MTLVRAGYVVAALALAGLILWAAGAASFGDSFSRISSDPWGLVTLADLYLGFAVLGAVIVWVERPFRAALWILAMLALGNVVAALWLAFRASLLASSLRRAR